MKILIKIRRSKKKSNISESKILRKEILKRYKKLGEDFVKMTVTDEKLAKLKTLFRNLQADTKSVLFTEEKINEKLLKKTKKFKVW